MEEGGEEASLGLTGNLNGVETGQGATRQIHLKARPTQSAISSLEGGKRRPLGVNAAEFAWLWPTFAALMRGDVFTSKVLLFEKESSLSRHPRKHRQVKGFCSPLQAV